MSKPTIGITIGDPAGIGPEVVLLALADPEVHERCVPVVIGHAGLLRRCSEASGAPMGDFRIVDVETPGIDSIQPGLVSAEAGAAADAYVKRACEMGLAGEIDAIATAPINKEALRLAGIDHIGHTEMLASYLAARSGDHGYNGGASVCCGNAGGAKPVSSTELSSRSIREALTLFITENMRIFFLSRHLSLRQAIDYITADRVYEFVHRVDSAMADLGYARPRIGLAALNPHASDGGQFGTEERDCLIPAAERARADGIDVTDPIGADSVFNMALEGRFDCVISLYHDQGHIAAKTRDFHGTVTATLGLPVLRTSVDHGTALDIAWQGLANPTGMKKAILAILDLRR